MSNSEIKNTPCACCKEREANKKNTHYLTDGIIRTALNLDGSNAREKGMYFNMSDISHIEFNFQRGTDMEKLEEELGREPTPEEIARARKNAYAVDYVFCDRCEKIFTKIETDFIQNTLPLLRSADLTTKKVLTISSVKTVRLFWYIQIWRSAVCEPRLNISDKIKEELRNLILRYKTVTQEEMTKYPLLVTYLETLGGPEAFTSNFVGFINSTDPIIIFMNDFVVQFSENPLAFQADHLEGFNAVNYRDFINYKEDKFAIQIMSDVERNAFIGQRHRKDADDRLHHFADSLSTIWIKLFGTEPSAKLTRSFLDEVTANLGDSILNYSKENIIKITTEFVLRNAPKN